MTEAIAASQQGLVLARRRGVGAGRATRRSVRARGAQGAGAHRDPRRDLTQALGNLTFNPISALTHSTLVDICQFPPTRELATAMMREAEQVANKLGVGFRVTRKKRIAGAEKVGRHKTSMLQGVEAGRDLEIDALVGAVIELGALTGVPTPHIDTAYALVELLGRKMRGERVSIRAQPAG